MFAQAGLDAPVISKACHTLVDVRAARKAGVDMILFSPVFGKWADGVEVAAGVGVPGLATACEGAEGIPVLALGGVTAVNAVECLRAGAAGVAGIRIFGV